MKFLFSIVLLFALGLYNYEFILKIKYLVISTALVSFLYIVSNLRYDFSILPLYIFTKIQGKKFKLTNDMKEIKTILKIKDKGYAIEELIASPAWLPILSVESTNGKIWETLRKNLLNFIEYIPSKEKLGQITKDESNYLISKKIILDSKIISKTTLKIFLKWLFSENHLKLNQNFSHSNSESNNLINNLEQIKCNLKNENDSDPFEIKDNVTVASDSEEKKDEFNFINQFLTEEFLENMYLSSLEYRKEIAVKGKGCPLKKRYAVDEIISILNKSKFSSLHEWEKPECFSFIMQPFIISPMINISDIAVTLNKFSKEYEDKKFDNYLRYLDYCLFNEHPFPVLERYEESTNTQYFVDLKRLRKEVPESEGNIVNFGIGIRGCLGRVYAKEFIKSFFEDYMDKKELFKPEENHLYSGRDNDNVNFYESLYQMRVLFTVIKNEICRNYGF